MFLPFFIGAKETYFRNPDLNPLIRVTIYFFLILSKWRKTIFGSHVILPLHYPLLPGIPATLASLSFPSPLTLPLLGITRHLVTNHQAIFPRLHLVPNYCPFLTSKCYCTSCSPNPPMPPSSTSSQILVEYAKSGRSSCKKCSETIASNALRLGLVTRDNRGFDVTKWHHFDCFPYGFESVASAEAIKGFSSLKSSDQEALKQFLAGHDKSRERDDDATEDIQNEPKKPNTKKRKGDEATEETQNKQVTNPKKRKSYTSDVEVGVNFIFSVSDIKSKYKEATLLPKWKAFQTVIFLEQDDGLHNSSKIAAFDFDGCLAKTDVKRVGADAWSLMYPSIPVKLQSLYSDGYKLVIFTNESNIERWKNKRQVAVDSKIGRLNNFIKKVKVPIQVFIACGLGKSLKQNKEAEDPFRKPRLGMWQLMEKHFNSGIAIDMDQSFYVGDAAGRVKDHSDADVKFAEEIGLKFYVPEEFFDSQGK